MSDEKRVYYIIGMIISTDGTCTGDQEFTTVRIRDVPWIGDVHIVPIVL
jgi:hypothetical protein